MLTRDLNIVKVCGIYRIQKMDWNNDNWQKTLWWKLALCLLIALAWMSLTSRVFSSQGNAAEPSSAVTAENDSSDGKPSFLVQVMRNLFNSKRLIEILGQKEVWILAFIVLNAIV